MKWKNFDEKKWLKICDKQLAAIKEEWPVITGSDRAMGSVRVARANIERAGFKDHIRVTCHDIGEKHPLTTSGVVLINPPYGERLNEADIPGLYKHIGNCFKKNFIGFDCWLLTSSPEGAASVGLAAKRKIKLFNGALECRLLKYPVYAGSKRKPDLSEKENDG
jgi:putative N6-adenine-specific DNA methylase